MSVDILGTSWDQCQSMVQYSFTSTETRRLVRTDSPGRPSRLSHNSWTMWIWSVTMRTDICDPICFNTSQEFSTASYIYYLNIFVTESEIIIMPEKREKSETKNISFQLQLGCFSSKSVLIIIKGRALLAFHNRNIHDDKTTIRFHYNPNVKKYDYYLRLRCWTCPVQRFFKSNALFRGRHFSC